MIIKQLITFFLVSILTVQIIKGQESPYLFPEEIQGLNFNEDFKKQIQSFYWFNLGEYEKAKEYHELSVGGGGILSNEAFERFQQLERSNARKAILKESKDQAVVMFNSAHHTNTAYTFIRNLLPELKSQGFSHIAIETFKEERITSNGHLTVSGTGYYHEPQFMKMIRSAVELGYSLHGYGGSCTNKGEDCSRDRQQAVNLANIHSQIKEGRLLVIAGFDHINEREDHPDWGKAMAAEFTSITGIDPLTIEQEEMQSRFSSRFDNPYRKAIGLLKEPVVLKKQDNQYWIEPDGDAFDMQVFHPASRYYKGFSNNELAKSDRVIHLDSLMKTYGEPDDFSYPIIVQLYKKNEWDLYQREAAPYDVAFIDSKNGPDNFLVIPTNEELILLVRKQDDDINIYLDAQPMEAILVEGATVFDDQKWKERDFYMVDGAIRDEIEGIPSDTLDFAGKYITPGFADGHTHNLDRSWQKYLINQYLSEGTLYIQNLTSKSEGAAQFRKVLEEENALQVNYANWGFTSTVGHPFLAYEPYAMGLRDASKWSELADSIRQSRLDLYNSYAFVNEVSQLDSIWPRYLDTNPDITKIYYFNEEGISDKIMGAHGLRLDVAKAIIDSAHTAGLKVYAHIEDRHDFAKMVEAGVDGFAHMPGYGWNGDASTFEKYFLPDSLLHEAAKRGIVINPTAALASFRLEGAQLDTAAGFQYDLIRRYRKMHGNLIIGSDVFNSTASKTYEYYAKQFPMSDEALLSLISTETSMQIFPNSALGQIKEGFKADFLVFDEMPVKNEKIVKPKKVYIEGRVIHKN